MLILSLAFISGFIGLSRSDFDNVTDSIFWNFSNNEMLDIIDLVESKLSIFIYPIPESVNRYLNKSQEQYDKIVRHFSAEFVFLNYFKSFISKESNLSTSSYIVTDPTKANVFIIDHDWALLDANGRCDVIYTEHFPTIINNVVDNYPYYNRSNGLDHFFFATYDNGPFCNPFCSPMDNPFDKGPKVELSIFKRIENVIFIGNLGMDKQHYIQTKYNNPVSNECHRAGHDIVIPQPIKQTRLDFHKLFYENMYPYRHYDSTFAGHFWQERWPLEAMCNKSYYDYKYNHLEKLECFEYGKQVGSHYIFGAKMDLLFKGYFNYNACGYGCWSQRLYESLASYTIPIIITDGGMQAFEKFIDWSKFTVKMSLSTWFNETLRNKYRQNIRYESEIYRNITIKCMNNYNSKKKSNWPNILNLFINNKNRLNMNEFNFLDIKCNELKNTFIYNKIKYYHQLIEWVDFNNLSSRINALKLLQIEIYCRIRNIYDFNDTINNKYNFDIICSKPSDYTARLQYF